MYNEIETIYRNILEKVNKEEKKYSEYYIYTPNGFTKYEKYLNKKNLSLNLKIKENRKERIIEILKDLHIDYKISNDNKYYMIVELKKECNYIVIDYVVNSHVTIPKSFLNHFGYKTQKGIMIDYIDINSMEIESKKTKEYGTTYGYYSKRIEDLLSINFETRIAKITKVISEFRKGRIDNITFTSEEINDIYNFFDITTYRKPKILKQINEQSLTSQLVGGYNHDYLLQLVANGKFPHIYEGLKFNVIINKTSRDFVINDNMIASINCDDENEIIILPINKKECLALMNEEYHKKYLIDGQLYFMKIEEEKDIEMINKYIFIRAKHYKENVIGTRKELELLLKS